MITDYDALVSAAAHGLARSEGVMLQSPEQPEWDLYHKRARLVIYTVQQADQLRGWYPAAKPEY